MKEWETVAKYLAIKHISSTMSDLTILMDEEDKVNYVLMSAKVEIEQAKKDIKNPSNWWKFWEEKKI